MVDRYGEIARIRAHPTEMFISTTEWDSGRNVLFSTHDPFEWTDEERVLQFLASLTIPWICTERVVIRGTRYCDGALSNNMPIGPLLARGCDHVVIVDPSPNPDTRGRRRLEGLLRPLSRIPGTPARIATGFVRAMTARPPVSPEDVQVTVVVPPGDLKVRALDFRSLATIDQSLEAGERAGKRVARELTEAP